MNANNEFYQNSMVNIRKDNDEWRDAAGTCSSNLIENQMQYILYYYNYGVRGLFMSPNGEYNMRTTGITEHLSDCVLCDPAVAIEVNTILVSGYTFTPGESFVVTLNGTPVTLSGDEVTPNDGKAYYLSVGGGPDGKPRYTIINEERDFVFEIV